MKKLLFVVFMIVGFSAFADITINPQESSEFDLSWRNPTQYTDDSPLPSENILHTVVQQSTDGTIWITLPDTVPHVAGNAVESVTYLTAPMGEGVYRYRVMTVVIGNMVSDPSNIQTVTLFIPKPSQPPVMLDPVAR